MEVNQINLSIIASDLDYVLRISNPLWRFNSNLVISIARTVMQFLNIDPPSFPKVNAQAFIYSVIAANTY